MGMGARYFDPIILATLHPEYGFWQRHRENLFAIAFGLFDVFTGERYLDAVNFSAKLDFGRIQQLGIEFFILRTIQLNDFFFRLDRNDTGHE
jgi:hypothetical protein